MKVEEKPVPQRVYTIDPEDLFVCTKCQKTLEFRLLSARHNPYVGSGAWSKLGPFVAHSFACPKCGRVLFSGMEKTSA